MIIIKRLCFIIVGIILAIALIDLGGSIYNNYHYYHYPYVSGKFGIICYKREQKSHGNIKYHIYWKTLEQCQNYVNKNK